jgi:hypothetical protein
MAQAVSERLSRRVKMHITKSQAVSVLLTFLLLCASTLGATTVIVIITSHGLVISTDSKMSTITTLAGDTSRIGEGTTKKFVLVQDRIFVASIGHADIRRGPAHYNFVTWMENLRASLPKNISVDDLASTIETESAKVFASFNAVLKAGDLKRSFPTDTCSPFVEYVIAGYQSGTPTVYVVQFYVDWNENKLVGPRRISIDSSKTMSGDFRVYVFGFKEALTDILDPHSYAYKKAKASYPTAFGDLLAHKDVSLGEAVSLARVFVRIEQNTNPSDVGGDIQMVRIFPSGLATEVSQ